MIRLLLMLVILSPTVCIAQDFSHMAKFADFELGMSHSAFLEKLESWGPVHIKNDLSKGPEGAIQCEQHVGIFDCHIPDKLKKPFRSLTAVFDPLDTKQPMARLVLRFTGNLQDAYSGVMGKAKGQPNVALGIALANEAAVIAGVEDLCRESKVMCDAHGWKWKAKNSLRTAILTFAKSISAKSQGPFDALALTLTDDSLIATMVNISKQREQRLNEEKTKKLGF